MPRAKVNYGESEKKLNLEIGNRLRKIRQMKGLSMRDISMKIGVTHQQFQKYEMGDNTIPISRVLHISRILDVDVNYLIQGDKKTDSIIELVSMSFYEHIRRFNELSSRQKTIIGSVICEFLKINK